MNGFSVEKRQRSRGFEINLWTKHHCFLCLNLTTTQNEDDLEFSSSSLPFKNLCKYLEIDLMEKLLSNKNIQAPTVLQKIGSSIEKASLKISLCSQCSRTTNKFSNLFQELERIRLEMDHCLVSISQGILNGEGNPKLQQSYQELMSDDMHSLFMLGFITELKKEISVKCSKPIGFNCKASQQIFKPDHAKNSLPETLITNATKSITKIVARNNSLSSLIDPEEEVVENGIEINNTTETLTVNLENGSDEINYYNYSSSDDDDDEDMFIPVLTKKRKRKDKDNSNSKARKVKRQSPDESQKSTTNIEKPNNNEDKETANNFASFSSSESDIFQPIITSSAKTGRRKLKRKSQENALDKIRKLLGSSELTNSQNLSSSEAVVDKKRQDDSVRRNNKKPGQKFNCTACHKEFTGKNNVTDHYKAFHMKNPYRCCCKKTFVYRNDLNRHKKVCSQQSQRKSLEQSEPELITLEEDEPETETVCVSQTQQHVEETAEPENDPLLPSSDEFFQNINLAN